MKIKILYTNNSTLSLLLQLRKISLLMLRVVYVYAMKCISGRTKLVCKNIWLLVIHEKRSFAITEEKFYGETVDTK